MRKLIYIITFTVLCATLSMAQETAVRLFGNKDDEKISRQKAEIEAKGLRVVVSDEAEQMRRLSQREISSGDEKFDRIFREGRELMDKEEWAKATAKFNEIVCDCPENKQVGAALYWLAYCYKKQNMFQEANQTIARLLKNFSGSNWAADARVMQSEINRFSAVGMATTVKPAQSVTGFAPYYNEGQSIFGIAAPPQVPLEREDEIRLAAFQTLLASDTKRALELMGSEILRTDSKASETLKREMIRSLRGSRIYVTGSYVNTSPVYSDSVSGQQNSTAVNAERQQNLNLMRETLMKGFQTEPNVKIRSEIIYSIAYINDEASYNYLSQLYVSERDKEIKKAIIISLGMPSLYAPFKSDSGQRVLIGVVRDNKRPQFDKLMGILRTENDAELRRLAFSNIQRFADWSGREGMIEILSQLYDTETDEPLRVSIINSFVGLKNEKATKKLLDIAKNDKSDQLRLLAIKSLRNNNSPEVLKFLEELIK